MRIFYFEMSTKLHPSSTTSVQFDVSEPPNSWNEEETTRFEVSEGLSPPTEAELQEIGR